MSNQDSELQPETPQETAMAITQALVYLSREASGAGLTRLAGAIGEVIEVAGLEAEGGAEKPN